MVPTFSTRARTELAARPAITSMPFGAVAPTARVTSVLLPRTSTDAVKEIAPVASSCSVAVGAPDASATAGRVSATRGATSHRRTRRVAVDDVVFIWNSLL